MGLCTRIPCLSPAMLLRQSNLFAYTEYLHIYLYPYHFLSSPLNCSHYRVYAVRLSSSALPNTLPDVLFSDDSQISTYDEAVSQPDPFDGKEAGPYLSYITAEIAASEFKPRFTIGDGSQTDRKEQFPNGALRASTHYTFFLRAYPKTRGDFLSSRARRQQAVNSNRQYVVFSSSGYTGISKTGKLDYMKL